MRTIIYNIGTLAGILPGDVRKLEGSQMNTVECIENAYLVIEDGIITDAKIIGGCDGNTRGLSQIVVGLPAKFVIEKWKGTPCMYKATSCPDQFAITIEEALAKMEEEKAAKA